MRLTSLSVANHSRVTDFRIDVRRHLVLVGTNESGKSSILRCLDLVLGKSTADLYATVTAADIREPQLPFTIAVELENDGMHTSMRFEAALDADGETVHISRTMGDDGHAVTAADLARIGWVYLSDSFPSNRETQHEIVDELLETVQLEQEEAVFEAVADQYARLLDSSPALLALRKRIADALTSALPMRCNPNNLVFVPGSKLNRNPFSDVHLQLRMHGKQRGLWEQSGGLRSIYTVALYDLLDEHVHIVGLDEPETHLHPTSQRNLARLLKEGASQKILATHSPDIIGEFEPDQIVVVRANGGVVQPRRDFLSEDDKLLLHMWVRDRLEPLTAEHVIVVEGVTDRALVEHCANVTGRNLDAHGVVLLEAGGCREMPAWQRVFGEHGFRVPLTQLVDEDAQGDLAHQYHVRAGELESKRVFVSHVDLEAEYIRALGVDLAYEALSRSDLFRPAETKSLRTARQQGTLNESMLADFCRMRANKTRAVLAVLPRISAKRARRIDSVQRLLTSVIGLA